MEGPLAPVRQAAHAAMLDGRDWLAGEWRMLYLSQLTSTAPPPHFFLLSFFSAANLLAADLHVDEGGTESKR